jgi:hypothetical protein
MRLLAAALLLVPALPAIAAAQPATAQPVAATKPAMPGRWQAHLDRASMPADYTFAAAGAGFHATTKSAAGIFFDPASKATGTYALDATFTQTKAPAHPEAYGLIFGGTGLDTDKAEYGYFVVRGDGKFLIKHHAPNGEVHTIVDWTPNAAIKPADAAGKATNALRVAAGKDSIRFLANGVQLHALPLGLNTDGAYGVRVNHMLDVQIAGPKVTPTK